MRANKLILDLYSTSGGTLPYEEYRKWYDKHDDVYIILKDAKIYTKVKRQEMFDRGMHYGCMIEHICFNTPEDVRKAALDLIEREQYMFATPEEFIEIESHNEDERVIKAFALAEEMIKGGC